MSDSGSSATALAPPQRRHESAHLGDRIFRVLCQAAGLSVVAIVASLTAVLVWQALPVLGRAWELGLFTSSTWIPNPPAGRPPVFGALAFVFGTLVTSTIAMLIAVPFGVATAAYLAEIAPGWLRRMGSFLIELLAAIPSVVYGFWGMFFLAPGVQKLFTVLGGPNTGGSGLLSAGLILAVMIVPYITAISFDVCRAVPRSQREGALALGATRWQMIRTAVLPYARPGIVAACFLALGRALGETMAVTMLIGNRPEIRPSLFGLGDSIASVIANQLNEADSERHRSALVALGLVLFLVTAVVNVLGRLLIARVGRPRLSHLQPSAAAPGGPAGANGEPTRRRPISPRNRRAQLVDRLMTGVLFSAVVLTLVPLFLILGYITFRGAAALDWAFFTQLPRTRTHTGGGVAHAFLGSAMLVGLASLFAVPLGVLGAIYLAEFRPSRTGATVRFVAELLGGVPSIVIGIFAYAVLVLPLGRFSAWAGSFALGVMMIPIVLRSAEESLKLVPQALRNASYALGASHWQTVVRVTVPAALPAMITGVFLAVGRIAGETAPLLLTAYGSNFWPRSPGEPTPFLPKYIYTYSMSPFPDWQRQAWAAALVLLVVVMTLNVGIRLLTGRRVVSASRAD